MNHFLDNLSGKQTIFPDNANKLISNNQTGMKTKQMESFQLNIRSTLRKSGPC